MAITAAIAVPHPPVIIPQVGGGREKEIQATINAYHKAMKQLAATHPQTVVLASPHAEMYFDWFHISPGRGARGDFSAFGAPQVKLEVSYDQPLADAIEAEARVRGIAAGFDGAQQDKLDHGCMVPLWFLKQYLPDVPVVRLGLSGFSLVEHYRFGQCIAQVTAQKRVAFIASGDLSHKLKSDGPYGFVPEGPELDREITKALAAGDFNRLLSIRPELAEKGAECGLKALVMMAGALDGIPLDAELLSYQDVFGVGYAVATFMPTAASNMQSTAPPPVEDEWVALARQALTAYIKEGQMLPLPQGLPNEMTARKAGVFVSLHKQGQLRGCIGTIMPSTSSVADEIIQNAISASTRDPRFQPVGPDEIDRLEIHVDVLGEAEDITGLDELDPKRYGVIVSYGGRRGLLLPDLDGVDSAVQQVDIARQKAGIPADTPLKLQRFEVIRHQ